MIFHRSFIVLIAALASEVYGHGAMVAVTGANGVTATGIGIDTSTPRDGTRRRPFQQDTSIIRDREIQSGKAGACGRTLEGGNNDVTAAVNAAASAGMPTMAADGTVSMTIHQINGDGAGPYTCEISTDATGANFTPMTVVTNVPGKNGNSRAKAQDFPLVAKAPAGTTCTGGPDGNACIVRCRNPARAGPFGGCAVVANPEGAAATSAAAEAPAAAATSSAAEGATAATETAATEAAATGAAATEATAAEAATGAKAATGTKAAAGGKAAAGAKTAGGKSQAAVDAADAADETDEEMDKRQTEEDLEDEEEDFDDEPVKRDTIPEPVVAKRSFLAPVFDLFAKRDYSRKRMVNSRIVNAEKRGKWI